MKQPIRRLFCLAAVTGSLIGAAEALRIGLTGYNVSQAGPQLYELRRERIASFIKDEQGKVLGGILADLPEVAHSASPVGPRR